MVERSLSAWKSIHGMLATPAGFALEGSSGAQDIVQVWLFPSVMGVSALQHSFSTHNKSLSLSEVHDSEVHELLMSFHFYIPRYEDQHNTKIHQIYGLNKSLNDLK